MTWRKGNVFVVLNCLLIGCAIIHANGDVRDRKDEQGSTSSAPASPASANAQRIAVLEARIAAQDSLMTSLTTLLNLVSSRQLEQQTTMSELENLVEDAQDEVNTAIANVRSDVTAKQTQVNTAIASVRSDVTAKHTQVNTAIASVRSDVTAIRSQVGSLNTALAAKRCEQGRANFIPRDQPTLAGHRKHTKHITFNRQFSGTPKITLGLAWLDANKDMNLRVWTAVSNASPSGFDLTATEWGDSITYGVVVDWMACS